MNSVTNDPIRKQLEDRLAKQKRAYHAMQIMNERNAKSDKLRREISDIEHKTALLEASNLPPDAEFIRTRNQKLAELERVKQTKADTIEKIKLDRQIAEMNAQIGAISSCRIRTKTKISSENATSRRCFTKGRRRESEIQCSCRSICSRCAMAASNER